MKLSYYNRDNDLNGLFIKNINQTGGAYGRTTGG
jgi:hypothetical protein